MKRKTWTKSIAILVAATIALCALPVTSLAATKLTKSQATTIENIIDLYMAATWEYDIYENDKGGTDSGDSKQSSFNVSKPNDALMISAAVCFLYYPETLPAKKSWMKPFEQTEAYELYFSEATVDRMCVELFGIKPKKHAYDIWSYDPDAGTYMITGDRGESATPKFSSYKALKNGDLEVTLNHRAFDDDYKTYNTGMKIIAVIRPSKSTTWGFTFRSISFKGTPRYKGGSGLG